MRITYTVPFRVDFCLDRETALALHPRWIAIVDRARAALPSSLPDAVIGNYGWAGAAALRDDAAKPQVVHGEEGMDDPTWFFRNYFTLRFGAPHAPLLLPRLDADPELDALLRSGTRFAWECQIIDNTVALLVLTAELDAAPFQRLLEARATREEADPFLEYGSAWATLVLAEQDGAIRDACTWARDSLAKPVRALSARPMPRLFEEATSPVYPFERARGHCKPRPMWAHLALGFREDERASLQAQRAAFLRLFASPPTRQLAAAWLDGGSNAYGWGATTVVEHARYGRQWLDGLCISEYYYACFDIVDTYLPFELAAQREESDRRRYRRVVETSRGIRHAVKRLCADYDDLRMKTASEGRQALVGYYETWRMEGLVAGLSTKIEWLEDLVAEASERSSERNQRTIQRILTFISLLGLISFVGGVRDYLAADYDPTAPGLLSELALKARKASVALGSFVVSLLAFAAYVLIDRRR